MKNKILVLSKADSSTLGILRNAVNLAKIITGEVTLCCVKKATDVVENENQLSAIRSINQEYFKIDNQLLSTIAKIANDENIKIAHKLSFGNLKEEIRKQIKENKPDVIVLGKQKSKIFSFFGDNIINFILKEFSGTVLITSEKLEIPANTELCLGLLHENEHQLDNQFKKALVSFAKKPVNHFQVNSNGTLKNEMDKTQGTIEYNLKKGNNTFKNIDKYLKKNKIQLLFIDRKKGEIGNVSKHINCSLLITN